MSRPAVTGDAGTIAATSESGELMGSSRRILFDDRVRPTF